jgi:NAD(P)-dependent dehydrogenase (short-subunit alcohol dehydrogenase family)
MTLAGKAALVSGAAGGIGRAIATAFAGSRAATSTSGVGRTRRG